MLLKFRSKSFQALKFSVTSIYVFEYRTKVLALPPLGTYCLQTLQVTSCDAVGHIFKNG